MSRFGRRFDREFWNYAAVILGAIVITVILTALVGCSAFNTRAARLSADFAPQHEDPWAEPTFPEIAEPPPTEDFVEAAQFRRFTGRTACATMGNVTPWIWRMTPNQLPRANVEMRLYGTRGTTPFPPEQNLFAWIVSHATQDPPLTSVMTPGCWLLVRPDATLFCFPGTRIEGRRVQAWYVANYRAVLSITPTPEMVGYSIFVQLAMHAPGQNLGEVLVSQAVEMIVGP